jgi:hypothetical protein
MDGFELDSLHSQEEMEKEVSGLGKICLKEQHT